MKRLKRILVFLLNLPYWLKHRAEVPAYREVIHVKPDAIHLRLKQDEILRLIKRIHRLNGCVVDGEWDTHAESESYKFKQQAINERFNKGKSWESTGIFQYQQRNSEKVTNSINDTLKKRYNRLDEIYQEIKKTGKLSSKEEHLITVSVGRHGQLIHVGQGAHRLAIARNLKLPKIPVVIGNVHPEGIPYLKNYRSASENL